jgi:hypothetical protein
MVRTGEERTFDTQPVMELEEMKGYGVESRRLETKGGPSYLVQLYDGALIVANS